MKKPILAIASLVFWVFTGCESVLTTRFTAPAPEPTLNAPPSDAELASAEYGIAPSATYEEQIRSSMGTLLKDPASTPFRFEAPKHGWLHRYLFEEQVQGKPQREGYVFGWKVHFFVNAKKSDGGYTGEQPYEAFFQDGKLRGIVQKSKHWDARGYSTWGLLVSVPVAH